MERFIKPFQGFFLSAMSLPGRCPSLWYISPLGKRNMPQYYVSVCLVEINWFLIYEQGTPIFDLGRGTVLLLLRQRKVGIKFSNAKCLFTEIE